MFQTCNLSQSADAPGCCQLRRSDDVCVSHWHCNKWHSFKRWLIKQRVLGVTAEAAASFCFLESHCVSARTNWCCYNRLLQIQWRHLVDNVVFKRLPSLSLCVSWREYQKSLHLTAHLWYLFHVEYWVSTEALKGQLDKNRWINDIINTDFQTSFYCPVKMCKTQLDFIFIVIKTAALLILIVELMFLMLISFLFSHSSILRSECRNQVPRGLQTARSLVLQTAP